MCMKKLIEIFGIVETKNKEQFNEVQAKMEVDWRIIRNITEGDRDSIWLGWKPSQWSAAILVTHSQYIHVRMTNTGGYTFNLMVVYRERTAVKRRELWSGISSLRSTSDSRDWLIVGDFNEIRHPAEREGHGAFDRAGATKFENAIAGFTELETIGGEFTWSNRVGALHTRSKLNRMLGNVHWIAR